MNNSKLIGATNYICMTSYTEATYKYDGCGLKNRTIDLILHFLHHRPFIRFIRCLYFNLVSLCLCTIKYDRHAHKYGQGQTSFMALNLKHQKLFKIRKKYTWIEQLQLQFFFLNIFRKVLYYHYQSSDGKLIMYWILIL